jgi:hypothetical protein
VALLALINFYLLSKFHVDQSPHQSSQDSSIKVLLISYPRLVTGEEVLMNQSKMMMMVCLELSAVPRSRLWEEDHM